MTTKELRKLIEVKRTVHYWGQKEECDPKFVAARMGNGKQLLQVFMLNTRPNYYVIRISDRWDDDELADHIDDIIVAIVEEWSEKERERQYLIEDMAERGIEPEHPEYNDDLDGNEDRLGWPVVSLDSGYCWNLMDWPSVPEKTRKRTP